jgi:hypothetical protein
MHFSNRVDPALVEYKRRNSSIAPKRDVVTDSAIEACYRCRPFECTPARL